MGRASHRDRARAAGLVRRGARARAPRRDLAPLAPPARHARPGERGRRGRCRRHADRARRRGSRRRRCPGGAGLTAPGGRCLEGATALSANHATSARRCGDASLRAERPHRQRPRRRWPSWSRWSGTRVLARRAGALRPRGAPYAGKLAGCSRGRNDWRDLSSGAERWRAAQTWPPLMVPTKPRPPRPRRRCVARVGRGRSGRRGRPRRAPRPCPRGREAGAIA